MDMGAPLGTDDVGCTLPIPVVLQDASDHSSKNISSLFTDILAGFGIKSGNISPRQLCS
jgi:hypothetical protein